jgi:hypothetical protein
MERTTVNMVMHTPKKTHIVPAGPPLVSEKAPVLESCQWILRVTAIEHLHHG